MQRRSADSVRYNGVARALHWTIAVLVIANLLTGFFHTPLEDTVRLIPYHKAIGITVLALSLARIAWRFTWTRPPYPDTMSNTEIFAAKSVHRLFYVLIVAMPLSGWIMASAGKYPLEWFGLFAIPKFTVTRDDALYTLGREAHGILGWLFLMLVILHVGAALRHHFLLRDQILQRMT